MGVVVMMIFALLMVLQVVQVVPFDELLLFLEARRGRDLWAVAVKRKKKFN